MKTLPLYPADKRVPLETAVSVITDSSCTRCSRHELARNRCIKGAGDAIPGTTLVVGSSPSYTVDVAGMSFVDDVGAWTRREISVVHQGPVFFTYATRCYAAGKPSDEEIDACRGYLASMVRALQPARIITLGDAAAYAVVSRRVNRLNKDKLHIPSANRPYSYLHETKTPVYMLRDVTAMSSNRFFTEEFRDDLRWVFQGQLPKLPPWDGVYHLVENEQDAIRACEYLRATKAVVFDTEFSGHMHSEFFQVDTLAVCRRGEDTAFVWGDDALANPAAILPLRQLLEDPAIVVGGHNLSIDLRAVELCPRLKCRPTNAVEDSMLARKLVRSDALVGLEIQAESVGMGGHKAEMQAALEQARESIALARKNAPESAVVIRGAFPRPLLAAVVYRDIPADSFAYGMVHAPLREKYCALDTVATSRLMVDVMDGQLPADEGCLRTYKTIMRRVPRLVANMENRGMAVNVAQIHVVDRYATMQVEAHRAELNGKYGRIDWTSPSQVADLFYDKLKIPNLEDGSVEGDVLKRLVDKHPVIATYTEFKKHQTIADRYGTSLLKFVSKDGRIHGRFNPIGTETGRWASDSPNQQNFPTRDEVYGPLIQRMFVAPTGRKLIKADYSQIEYRVAAYLSGDPVMQQIFIDGIDLHRRTAEMISDLAWGIPHATMVAYDDKQIKPYRSASKSVNFGVLYCLSISALAEQLKTTEKKAESLHGAIMGVFQVLNSWVEQQKTNILAYGFTRNSLFGEVGRRRFLSNAGSSDRSWVSSAQRQSVNTPPQGSAAEFTADAMCEFDEVADSIGLDALVISQVHDAIYLEVADSEVEYAAKLLKQIMQARGLGAVPLVAELELGSNLGEMRDLNL